MSVLHMHFWARCLAGLRLQLTYSPTKVQIVFGEFQNLINHFTTAWDYIEVDKLVEQMEGMLFHELASMNVIRWAWAKDQDRFFWEYSSHVNEIFEE
jgi:hypothetical protein